MIFTLIIHGTRQHLRLYYFYTCAFKHCESLVAFFFFFSPLRGKNLLIFTLKEEVEKNYCSVHSEHMLSISLLAADLSLPYLFAVIYLESRSYPAVTLTSVRCKLVKLCLLFFLPLESVE